ncbi:hypothetical protein BH11MYX3_BH11MYX3_25680 [soil metagenome]
MRYAGFATLLLGCGFSVGGSATTDGNGGTDSDSGAISSPRRLTFDTTGITTELDEVPVLVTIAAQIDRSKIVDPHTDLKFVDAESGDVLPFEIEAYNPTGEIVVWLRVPHLGPALAQSPVLLHFGTKVGMESAKEVWSSEESVHHFALDASDSTGHGHTGTLTGASLAPGYIGNSLIFDGTTDRATFAGATLDQWDEGTLEMWLRPKYTTISDVGFGQPGVLDNGNSFALGRFYVVATALVFQIDVRWSGASSFLHPELPLNTWSHLAWVYDGSKLRIYVNGVEALAETVGDHELANTDTPLVLGSITNAAKMEIDELRISRKGRSPDWMTIQQRSMTRALVTFSDP